MSAPALLPEGGRFGAVEIRSAERRLFIGGQAAALGSRAFDLLSALVARRDRVVGKDELLDVVWPGLVVEENNLQVQISALRKLLGPQAIATVPGRGYRFTLAQPDGDARAAPAPPLPALPARGGTRASRLLVVDDNKVHRLLLARSLQLMGHEVVVVENGLGALQQLHAERFDLLLLDLELPGLDGFGVLERRLADPPLQQVPVIVTSSVEGASAVARCVELGADDFLHKPVNPQLLKARVDSSLERKHLRDRQREMMARLAPGALGDGRVAAEARRGEATVLSVRLHGLDTALQPQEAFERLNEWTTLMLATVEEHGGRVAAATGDGLIAVFGVPDVIGRDGGAAWAAVRVAQEMGELTAALGAERAAPQAAAPTLHIGVAGGALLAGYTVTPRLAGPAWVGAPMQRALQLQEAAAAAAETALLDAATAEALAGRVALVPLVLASPAHGATATAYVLHNG